ncbi:MAG: diacylglycerol kinase family lipid kinase [Candidatus Latescibacteria bacterium]|jgi:YegS/Rv2252/BmrU family lipid kinase|nr:diacylglycerol kinase family lipid kinase [Candidatus Latescibacterota bacterium]
MGVDRLPSHTMGLRSTERMAERSPDIRFIVNPFAGTSRGDISATIGRVMGRPGSRYEITRTEEAGQATALAREAADQGTGTVVAVGGDGTINEVGRGLLGTGVALGIVPLGSGNALARELGIPLDPGEACRVLLDGRQEAIDVGWMGDAVFFSTAGVSLDAEVSWRYNQRGGNLRGFLPYVGLTLYALASYRPETITVTPEEGEALEVRPLILTVANASRFGNGAIIAPQARPDDGLLDICIIEKRHLARMVWHARRLFTGSIDRMPGARSVRGKSFRIERPTRGRCQVDGEPLSGGPVLDVRVEPKAIAVIVPRSA